MMTDKIKEMVIEQFGDSDYFKECAQQIVDNGADCGFNGFIEYNETVPFGERLRPYVKPILQEMADEFGIPGAYSLMATFRCCEGYSADEVADAWASSDDDNHTQVMNCLSWFALEEVAREYVDQRDAEAQMEREEC